MNIFGIGRALLVAFVAQVGVALVGCGSDGVSDGGSSSNDGSVVLPPGSEPCDALPLKTPRAPKLLWSCRRQNFLEKLRAMNHPQWQELIALADRTATPNARYGDNGDFAALAYQVTGDVKYAQKAYTQMMMQLEAHKQPDGNYTRELQIDFDIIYDWIQGALTEEQRKATEDILFSWVDQMLAKMPSNMPVRLTDTDQTTGNYFGSILLAIATKGNPKSDAILSNPIFGGLDATGTDLNNMRNAVQKYITDYSVGGQWMESAYYDVETLQLVGEGVEAMYTATGEDHFPEFWPFAEQVVRSQISQITPDLDNAVKWGDVEQPRDLEAWRRYQTLGMFTGLLSSKSEMLPLATQFTIDLKEQHKTDLPYRARFWYYFNPLGPTADWRKTMPLSQFASGQGILFAHDGWQTGDSQFFAHLRRPPMDTDHENNQFGDFQLYRKGAFVVTRPIGYGGGSIEPVAVSSMVLGGLDAMVNRKVVGQSSATDGSYFYVAGSADGSRYASTYYMPPDPFVSEWTRSFLYLPSTTHAVDTVVVFDRVGATAPNKLDRYQADDMERVMAAPALKQWIIHALVKPTITGDSTTWSVGNQQVELTSLFPTDRNATIVDEKSLSWPSMFPPDSERHFYVSLSPKSTQAWDTFLNVVQVADAVLGTKPARLASTDNGIQGTLVTRTGQKDAIALFSATQGARVRNASFTVAVSVKSDGADVYVTDLDPGKSWKVDGSDLTVDKGGLGHGTLSGSGDKMVQITAE